MTGLPHYAAGEVIKGFGRGSKDLGIPTANYSTEVVNNLPDEISTGIYCGFASVSNGPVHKMVISIGWNPTYENTIKSMETHILDLKTDNLYGRLLKIAIVNYIRPEKKFDSLEELIDVINSDISFARDELDKPEYEKYKVDTFFTP